MDHFKYSGSIEDIIEESNGTVIDCIEGCLIDSVLIDSSAGYIAMIETFQNVWTSVYTVYMGNNDEVYGVWENYMDKVKGEEV